MPAPRERQQQVHGDRTGAALTVGGKFRAQHRRRHDAELPEAASVRIATVSLARAEPAPESGSDDRLLQAELLTEAHRAIVVRAEFAPAAGPP